MEKSHVYTVCPPGPWQKVAVKFNQLCGEYMEMCASSFSLMISYYKVNTYMQYSALVVLCSDLIKIPKQSRFFFFLFSFVILRCKSIPVGFCCRKRLCSSFQQTVTSLWAASCTKRLSFSQDRVSCVPEKNIPNTWNWKEPKAEQKNGTFFHHWKTTDRLFPATPPVKLGR